MTTTYECPNCAGTGHLPHFSHIANGDCFMCGATGKVEIKPTVETPRCKPAPLKEITLLGEPAWVGASGDMLYVQLEDQSRVLIDAAAARQGRIEWVFDDEDGRNCSLSCGIQDKGWTLADIKADLERQLKR